MEIGVKHELYDKLAFYWSGGLHSEVISEVLNSSVEREKSILKDYSEIDEILNRIMNKGNLAELEKEIYMEYAPYKFMKIYKYEIYNPLKNKVKLENEYLIDELYNCEGNLPPTEYLNEFKLIYATFTTNIDLLNDCGNFDKNWELIESIILDMWESFSKGLRVLHKDKYYDSKVEKWNQEFENSLNPLKDLVNSIEKYIEYDKIPEIKETKIHKKIHRATLEVLMEK